MSQLQEIAKEESKLEMTPMIDVTFLLLIFFMCTIKFKTLEGRLSANLPKDVGVNQSEAEPVEKVDIQMHMRNEGTKRDARDITKAWTKGPFQWGPDRRIEYYIGARKTFNIADVESALNKAIAADPEKGATIKPWPDVCYSDVIKVLDLAMTAGYTDVTFTGAR